MSQFLLFLCKWFYLSIYEGHLKSSWTHRITPSRNFMEVRWRSLFRSTSLGKRCTCYNAPPTSRKRAADRLPQASGRLFLASELPFRGWKSKSHGARSGLYGGCSNGVPPISVSASIATLAMWVWHCLDSCSAIPKGFFWNDRNANS
jgi:hypothetical protein